MGHLRDYTSEGFCIKLKPCIVVVIYLFMPPEGPSTLSLFTQHLSRTVKAAIVIPPYVLDVITGMLLGDSCISKPSISGQSRLQ